MKLLISADWHLTENKPRCRTDEDFFSFMKNILIQVLSYMNKYQASLVIVGDIFDKYDVSYKVLNLFIQFVNHIPNNKHIYFIEGNHDLPFHSQQHKNISAIEVLNKIIMKHPNIGWIGELGNYKNFNGEVEGENKEIMFVHQLVVDGNSNIPNGTNAKDLLKEYPNAKYIFTGDNHKKFIYEYKNRYVVNPGSLFRNDASQKNYQSSIYYVDTKIDKIKELKILDSIDLVDDEYIKKENEKINKMKAFVEGVKNTKTISLDYIKNVIKSIMKNKLDEDTKKEIYELIEETKEE